MIWSSWGMKENLVADPDVFLCHNCGDCTTYCPRGAKPSEVLGAIRAYAYTMYGWPAGLAKLATSAKNLPILIGIPVLVIFVMWLISGGMHIPSKEEFSKYGYQHFFGHWEFKWYAKNIFFIVLIMLTSLGIAAISLYKGLTTMWKTMSENAEIGSAYRPSITQFVTQFLWPSLVEIVQQLHEGVDAGCKRLGDLLRISEAELLSYKNFGETSLTEIKEILKNKGLHLGMTSDELMSRDLGEQMEPAVATIMPRMIEVSGLTNDVR